MFRLCVCWCILRMQKCQGCRNLFVLEMIWCSYLFSYIFPCIVHIPILLVWWYLAICRLRSAFIVFAISSRGRGRFESTFRIRACKNSILRYQHTCRSTSNLHHEFHPYSCNNKGVVFWKWSFKSALLVLPKATSTGYMLELFRWQSCPYSDRFPHRNPLLGFSLAHFKTRKKGTDAVVLKGAVL